MAIQIQNRLEIFKGNKLLVPGCEPTSAFTSPTLAENRECAASVVDLTDALAAIPGATVVAWSNPRTRFFVLPSGPPPSPDNCKSCIPQPDYYQILRDIGQPVDVPSVFDKNRYPKSVGEICSAFPLKGVF